jgi:hypothetical protein
MTLCAIPSSKSLIESVYSPLLVIQKTNKKFDYSCILGYLPRDQHPNGRNHHRREPNKHNQTTILSHK